MRCKNKITHKSTKIYDINGLSKYIKKNIDESMSNNMGSFCFTFILDDDLEENIIKEMHDLLSEYSVFVDLHNKIFSIKW